MNAWRWFGALLLGTVTCLGVDYTDAYDVPVFVGGADHDAPVRSRDAAHGAAAHHGRRIVPHDRQPPPP